MIEVKKLAKNQGWFLDIVKRAPSKVKGNDPNRNENFITLEYFCDVLD